MGIGLGVVLLVLGLILVLDVIPAFSFAGLNETSLGWIFLIAGILAIVLALVMNKQRGETRHVEERRYDGPTR